VVDAFSPDRAFAKVKDLMPFWMGRFQSPQLLCSGLCRRALLADHPTASPLKPKRCLFC
jgi:hypothetical protein